MGKITVVIIAKNAESQIADCLDSVSFCDEIIVIDNKSTDRTPEIAKQFAVKIFTYESSSFSELRNAGLVKAKGEWILYVDADERVNSTLKEEILNLLDNPSKTYSAYRIKRKNFYLGKHEWPKIEKLERLFLKKKLKEWRGQLHETAIVDGETAEIEDGYLLHYTHRDLSSMLSKTIQWSEIEANLRFKANHPKVTWWRFPRVILTAFFDSYIKQKGYKAGIVGVIESIFQGFSMFITYARLWEMQQRNKEIMKVKN